MTLKFTAIHYWHYFSFVIMPFAVAIFLFFTGLWQYGFCALGVGTCALVPLYQVMTFGEQIHFDEERIELHFRNLQKSILMSEVDRIFSVDGGDFLIIKTVDGQKTIIPDRWGMEEFIREARKKFNFKFQKSN